MYKFATGAWKTAAHNNIIYYVLSQSIIIGLLTPSIYYVLYIYILYYYMMSHAIVFFSKAVNVIVRFFLPSRIHPEYCSALLFFNPFTEQSTAGI